MYQWLLFLHIGSVLVFMLAHGVQVTVTWKKRWEKDPARNQALFEALPGGTWTLRLPIVGVIGSGLILVAFLGVWTQWWIWLSLLLLIVIWVTMWRWGGGYYNLIQETAERAIAAAGTPDEPAARADFDKARLDWRTPAMTVVGILGVAAILWLMIFRPA
jgi:hypothetical protein